MKNNQKSSIELYVDLLSIYTYVYAHHFALHLRRFNTRSKHKCRKYFNTIFVVILITACFGIRLLFHSFVVLVSIQNESNPESKCELNVVATAPVAVVIPRN